METPEHKLSKLDEQLFEDKVKLEIKLTGVHPNHQEKDLNLQGRLQKFHLSLGQVSLAQSETIQYYEPLT